jgi:uncharacterized protein involved in cysteine biosynthesis
MKAITVLSNVALLGFLMTNYADYDWRIIDFLTSLPDFEDLRFFLGEWMVILTPLLNFGYLITND